MPGNRVPSATATGEYYTKHRKYDCPEKVYAEDWFDFVEHERNTFTLNEQCIYYDKLNMVLSIIWAG
jgi:hypothetical protein